MNNILIGLARKWLKDNLKTLPERNITMFKRMYTQKRNGEAVDLQEIDLDELIDAIDSDRLDTAMLQTKRTMDALKQPEV